MIAAVVAVRQWISPRAVLAAAPLRLRLQFWLLVGSGVLLATVPVVAQQGDVMPSSWLSSWQFLALLVTWAFTLGGVMTRLNTVKDDLAKRLDALESTVVRRDTLADKLATMDAKLDTLNKLLERSERDWRESHHGSKE